MTEEELATILTNLITHLKQMRDDRRGSALNAPSGSGNEGKAPKRAKSKLPCNTDLLQWEAELHFELSEPAEELHQDYPGDTWPTPRMDPTRGNDTVAWAMWLAHPRHIPLIMQKEWDFPQWVQEKESELRHMLHPTEPHKIARPNMATEHGELPTLCTTEQLCSAYNVQPATIRKWKERGKIEPAGTQTLTAGETIDLWKISEPS